MYFSLDLTQFIYYSTQEIHSFQFEQKDKETFLISCCIFIPYNYRIVAQSRMSYLSSFINCCSGNIEISDNLYIANRFMNLFDTIDHDCLTEI